MNILYLIFLSFWAVDFLLRSFPQSWCCSLVFYSTMIIIGTSYLVWKCLRLRVYICLRFIFNPDHLSFIFYIQMDLQKSSPATGCIEGASITVQTLPGHSIFLFNIFIVFVLHIYILDDLRWFFLNDFPLSPDYNF